MSTEKTRASRLITQIITSGFVVSVACDGEEFLIKRSANHTAIMRELNASGLDVLIIRDPANDFARIGSIMLVWGNDPSGDELVADHSDTPIISAIVEATGC